MAYFTDFQDYFFLCSDISPEEKRKLNDYLQPSCRMKSCQVAECELRKLSRNSVSHVS